MDIIENAKQHFQQKETKHIEVPEWGDENGPLIIYAEPLTLNDKQRVYKKAKEGELLSLAWVLIWFARDKNGENLFTIEHKHALIHAVDPAVLSKIANEIMEAPTVEELEKK
ncbi:MAG: hypothetical protein SWH54_04625 [Thermodesulfobacteriota bacterium]|nr:hypothetical protein [Thermodesulfobacteriota bacterium]